MPELLLVATVLAAGLACPAMMWWQHRRGRHAPCCREGRSEVASLESLQERQAAVSARIAQVEKEMRLG